MFILKFYFVNYFVTIITLKAILIVIFINFLFLLFLLFLLIYYYYLNFLIFPFSYYSNCYLLCDDYIATTNLNYFKF